jgi:catechol 2,3-dioxygenase-like lactoylglutathione lyase family enzyme
MREAISGILQLALASTFVDSIFHWSRVQTHNMDTNASPTNKPPVFGVMETSLYVDDLGVTTAFYQHVFGFAINFAADRLVSLAVCPGQVLLLFTKQGSIALPKGGHHGDGQLHMAFSVAAEQIEPWRAHLAALGIPLDDEIHWDRGGVSLYFRDPDGHLLEVASPGVWANY